MAWGVHSYISMNAQPSTRGDTMKATMLVTKINKMGFHAFQRPGGQGLVYVSTEHGDDAADYYGEFRGGYAWINPKLQKLVTRLGAYWEWESPGCIVTFIG